MGPWFIIGGPILITTGGRAELPAAHRRAKLAAALAATHLRRALAVGRAHLARAHHRRLRAIELLLAATRAAALAGAVAHPHPAPWPILVIESLTTAGATPRATIELIAAGSTSRAAVELVIGAAAGAGAIALAPPHAHAGRQGLAAVGALHFRSLAALRALAAGAILRLGDGRNHHRRRDHRTTEYPLEHCRTPV
jgi:hypothetical protein